MKPWRGPFALPRALLERHGVTPEWRASIEWLASFADAREWRRVCRRVSRVEPRRGVDRRFDTPLPPTNLRLFKQTWHALVSLVRPLLGAEGVAILTMGLAGAAARLPRARVLVGEGCPSSTVRELGGPRSGYKGSAPANRARREEILALLREREGLEPAGALARHALDDPEGDAIDSLVLAAAARRFAASGQ